MLSFYYKVLSRLPSKKGKDALDELRKFMAREGGINFNIRPVEDETGEYFVAEATDTNDKQIITSGKSLAELDYNIKDAIFTSFHVPAYYCNSAELTSPLTQEIKLRYATR